MMTVINAALEILGDNAAFKILGALEILKITYYSVICNQILISDFIFITHY